MIMIRTPRNLNQVIINELVHSTGAMSGFMGTNPSTSNVITKSFGFLVYDNVEEMRKAVPAIAAIDLLGSFQAPPRAMFGLPEMCKVCGLLKDEADERNRWKDNRSV
jgi:hypothetical protein